MKKTVLILALITSFNAQAEIASGDDCGTNCYWSISDDGTLSVFAGEDNEGKGSIGHYGFNLNDTSTTAPWGIYKENIKNIEIKEGITDLGYDAFVRLSSQNPIVLPQSISTISQNGLYTVRTPEVIIPDTVTSVGFQAFAWSGISQINIPPSVTEIDQFAFRGAPLKNVVIPDTVESIADGAFSFPYLLTLVIGENTQVGTIFNYASEQPDLSKLKMYCGENNALECTDALKNVGTNDENIANILQIYTKDGNGFYQIDDKLYATADLMTKGAACDNAQNCQDILDAASQGKPFEVGGKYYATLDLFANKKSCENQSQCEEMLSASKQNAPFIVGGKFYASLDDFLTGNYERKRIYTVDEANRVAGEKNRVSITYR